MTFSSMLRQSSSSRNQRGKAFKIKHALQIGLLVAVCIWLLYQVKHSHDKKKDLTDQSVVTNGGKDSAKRGVEIVGSEMFNLGRKDLNDKIEMATSKREETEEVKELEEESKEVETEDEERGAGDDWIDENDRVKPEEDAEQEEFLEGEEEKESEEDKEFEEEAVVETEEGKREVKEESKEDAESATNGLIRDTQILSAENETMEKETAKNFEQVEEEEKEVIDTTTTLPVRVTEEAAVQETKPINTAELTAVSKVSEGVDDVSATTDNRTGGNLESPKDEEGDVNMPAAVPGVAETKRSEDSRTESKEETKSSLLGNANVTEEELKTVPDPMEKPIENLDANVTKNETAIEEHEERSDEVPDQHERDENTREVTEEVVVATIESDDSSSNALEVTGANEVLTDLDKSTLPLPEVEDSNHKEISAE